MLRRTTLIWFTILLGAIINGAIRETFLKLRLGDATAHVISALLLSAAVFFVTWISIRWIAPSQPRDGWAIGVWWLTLTLAFEFLGGHYLFGTPWQVLLNDYRIFDGRLWLLVLASTLLAPVAMNPHRRRTIMQPS